jgi:hypothetical protein
MKTLSAVSLRTTRDILGLVDFRVFPPLRSDWVGLDQNTMIKRSLQVRDAPSSTDPEYPGC